MLWQTNNCLLCSDVSKTTVPVEEVWFSLYGKLSYCSLEQQCSEANTAVPGTLTSPRYQTCDSWPTISHPVHSLFSIARWRVRRKV